MESVANCYGKVWVFGVFNIPLRVPLEVVFMGFDAGFKMGNLFFEVSLLLDMALLSNSDGTDQGSGNPLKCDGIDISFHGEGCGDRTRGPQSFEGWGLLDLWLGEREWVGGYEA